MAETEELAEAPVEEASATEPTEAPAEEAPPAEETPEADQRAEAIDPADAMDELLADEADDLDLDIDEPETPPKGQEPPTEGKEPPAEAPLSEASPPPVEPAPVEPTVPVEAPPPEQAPPPAPEEAAPAAEPEGPAPTMEDLRTQYQANRGELEKIVATQHYNLNEEQVTRMDDGDPTVISEMMAKVYMDAVTGSVAHMITHLPHMMESMITSRDSNATHEKAFFDAWPQLNAASHSETIGKFGQAYRQVNPTASAADFIRDVGASTLVALGIPPTAIGAETPAQGGNGGIPSEPQPKPFVPGGTGRGGAAPLDQLGPYEALAEEMAFEELDLDK